MEFTNSFQKMTPKPKNLFSTGILLIIAALFIYYISRHISDFKQLSLVNPVYLVVLVVLFTFNYFLTGIITQNLIYPLGVRLKGTEAFAISVVTGFYNLITPFRGGAVTRAVYLKKRHNFRYTDFLATLAGMYVITFLIASFLGLISILYINYIYNSFSWLIFFIFLSVFLPLLIIVALSPKIPLTKNKWLNRFIKVVNGWHLIKNNKRVIFIILTISLIQLILSSLMLYLQFQVFGINIEFIKCLLLTSISSLSLLIAITPAGLGINEAVIVFSALTINITPAQSLSVALLGRAVQMTVLFVLGPIFSIILMKGVKNNSNKNDN